MKCVQKGVNCDMLVVISLVAVMTHLFCAFRVVREGNVQDQVVALDAVFIVGGNQKVFRINNP